MDGDFAAGDEVLELIPAIQDDEFFYDDYYDDLYNDVDFGDGFFQPLCSNNSTAPEREHDKLNNDNHQPPPAAAAQAPGIIEEANTEKAPDVGLPSDFPGEAQARAPNTSDSGNQGFVSKGGSLGNGEEGFSRQGGGFETEAPTRLRISNGNVGFAREGGGVGGGNVSSGGGGGTGDAGGLTTLFVGELHWWTTDDDVEGELCKYGQVKEVRFFDEKATGKSKGYCQVEFCDPVAAAACAEGMNGHVFNGRPCVAVLASHYSIRKMGDAQVNRNRQQAAAGRLQHPADLVQKGRGAGGPMMNGNYGQGGGGGRGDWRRGGPMGSNNRGPVENMRNRMGPTGGRGIMDNEGIINPPPPVLHPGAIFGQGFDPNGFATGVGRMSSGFGSLPAGPAGAPFGGMMLSFPLGVAPHGNPAFFWGEMPGGDVGVWQDTNMGGWRGEEQLGYGENAVPDQYYVQVNQGKDRGLNREQSDVPDRRHDMEKESDHHSWQDRIYHDEREMVRDRDWEWEREREKEKERAWEREKERARGRDRERGRERERVRGKDREREKEREKERERDQERLKDRNRERDRDMHRDERHKHGHHYRHRDHEAERYDDWRRSSRAQIRSCDIEHSKRRRLSCERPVSLT